VVSKPFKPISSQDAVVCRSVSKVWAEGTKRAHVALRDVDLDVRPGEFIVLLGPSGCGKSTLLYLIAGLERESGGEVWSFGDRVAGPSPERSLIFQETSLFPWLTVGASASLSAAKAPGPAGPRRARCSPASA
jgi:NitT/TauT family transport system ATP-binding protein